MVLPSSTPSVGIMVYCITPALDIYLSLPDRTPHTLMMMSHNICSMAFYNLWHCHSHLLLFYLHPSILLPSRLLLSKLTTHRQTHSQLIPMKLGYHSQISQPWPGLWHLSLWRKCGEMWWKRETIEVHHLWIILFKELIWLGLRHPPSGSLCSNIKGLQSYYLKENIEDHNLRKL